MLSLRRYLAVALFLAVCGGGAWLWEEVAAGEVRDRDAQAEAVETSVREMAARVAAIERDLLDRAEALAVNPRLRDVLLGETDRGEAVAVFNALRLPEGVAAELYTPVPDLIAWRGPGLPLDPATRRLTFLNSVQSAAIVDGTFRQALVVWHPIREGGRVIGTVRVVRLVQIVVPVRNQYLRDVDLLAEHARGLPAPVRVELGDPALETPEGARIEELRSLDGAYLGRLIAMPPTLERLEQATRYGYREAVVFFLALLLGWGLFGLVQVVRLLLARALQEERAVAWGAFAGGALVLAVAWVGARYALLELRIPARFVADRPTPPAFDPAFLGSGLGGGLAGSVMELVITALFALAVGAGLVASGLAVLRARRARTRIRGEAGLGPAWIAGTVLAAVAGVTGLAGAALLVHRATEDATLGYFERTGPLPDGLVMLAFGAFLLVMLAAAAWMTGLALWVGLRGRQRAAAGAAAMLGVLAVAYALTPLGEVLPLWTAVGAVMLAVGAAVLLEREPSRWALPFSLRGALLAALALTVLTYPVVLTALQAKEDARVRDAAEDFADGEDARVAFALESVLLDARASETIRQALTNPVDPTLADSLAADLVTGSLLAALADYRVGLALRAPDGALLGRYFDEMALRTRTDTERLSPVPPDDPLGFSRLRRLYESEAALAGLAVERRPAEGRASKFRYAGIGAIRAAPDGPVLGWVVARAEPRPARYIVETPFPRVLVPAGLYHLAHEEWSFAEFENGVLLRSRGTDFGRLRLPVAVADLEPGEDRWRFERMEGQRARVYYLGVGPERVVAVRMATPTVFDHLYFVLRMLLSGLALAALAFLLGPLVRRAADLPPHRPRLRDRVLNRFLLVGLVSVVATGAIGRTVIVTQNRETVEEQLKQRLARVEAALVEEAVGDAAEAIPPERLLDRARPDLVGPRLGLDVNLYRGAELVASSRSQLVRQRLIEQRLPIDVVQALFVEGQRYAFSTERMGAFRYTTGYEALPDAAGRPAVVLAVPTLPEQFAIEADQARMVAYLFGVLLLLMLGIFGVATVLANRLTRPFRRLRVGLQAVGAGEAPAEPIPVESRDEVGEVIETFNAVWAQLEESRQKLATQERELAWREMARQVAHEIKNPLTPMRLSVQHLRRAYSRTSEGDGASDSRFGELLERVSGTLVEQIDALSRIANEFSRFGRLPERSMERIDLNEVVRQAAALIAEEPRVEVVLDLADEPLPIESDREELRRVYINLLKNAQQAIPEGERGTITLRTERRQEDGRVWAWSAVRDTGAGIPPEVQPRIFRPNFSTKTSGMGLGLAIARKAIEDVHGAIDFETEPGVGTTFWVRLPLAEAEAESPGPPEAEVQAAEEG